MSTRWDDPVEDLVDRAGEADALADVVEAHLDAFPLPVDEQAVAQAVARLEGRLQQASPPRRRRAPLRMAGALLALAAAAAVVWRLGVSPDRGVVSPVDATDGLAPIVAPTPPPTTTPLPAVTPLPSTRTFPTVQRTVHVEGDARWVGGESGGVAAVLVQEGEVRIDDTPVPPKQWALVTRDGAGTTHEVVFPDGEAPPPLDPEVWDDATVDPLLRELRWKSLPDETLSTLDRLLETP